DGHDQREPRMGERFPERGQLLHAAPHHEVGQVAAAIVQIQVPGHRIAAEAEEDALAEGEHAALPPGQPDAERDDRVAEVLGEQAQPERLQQQRRGDQGDGRDRGERQVSPDHVSALDLSATSPCGRTWRKPMTAANTSTLARPASDQNSAYELSKPSPAAASTAPRSCPSPPATTTRKASTM